MEHELTVLRAVSVPDGDLISKASVIEILDSLFRDRDEDRYDKGINWVLGKVRQEVEKLPAVSGGSERVADE